MGQSMDENKADDALRVAEEEQVVAVTGVSLLRIVGRRPCHERLLTVVLQVDRFVAYFELESFHLCHFS